MCASMAAGSRPVQPAMTSEETETFMSPLASSEEKVSLISGMWIPFARSVTLDERQHEERAEHAGADQHLQPGVEIASGADDPAHQQRRTGADQVAGAIIDANARRGDLRRNDLRRHGEQRRSRRTPAAGTAR